MKIISLALFLVKIVHIHCKNQPHCFNCEADVAQSAHKACAFKICGNFLSLLTFFFLNLNLFIFFLLEFITTASSDYQFVVFNRNTPVKFRVKALRNAYLMLTTELTDQEPIIEVCLGCIDNHRSMWFHGEVIPNSTIVVANTTNIISHRVYKDFWIDFKNNIIAIGQDNEFYPFLVWQRTEKLNINYIGVHTGRGFGLWHFRGVSFKEKWLNV